MFELMHKAMRRYARSLERAIGQLGEGDLTGARQLAEFWAHMRGEIVHHHTVEDTIFFPGLREVVPDAAVIERRLHEDHEALDIALEQLSAALDLLVRSQGSAVARRDARAAATTLAELLEDHLDREERETFPLFLTQVSATTFATFDAQAAASFDKKELPFMAPWLLAHASPDETERVYATSPAIMRILYKLFWRRSYERSYPLLADRAES
jgi:hemerythrin-like domain-containing protein